jgi:murein DD-endopeptidase MepM/ murein hydrolase activator NlpD
MDTPDFTSRPALRRALRASDPITQGSPHHRASFSAQIITETARLKIFLSQFARRATSSFTRISFARMVSHATILGVTAGALALSSGARHISQPEIGRNDVQRATPPPTERLNDDFPILAVGGPLLYQQAGIVRQADPYTVIPDRPRRGVITYTVEPGDALFGIANRFGLSPESVLWNNEDVLNNDPHRILPGTVLQIPPISGIIYTVKEGDTLDSIASAFKTTVDAIVVQGAQWNNLLNGKLPPVGSGLIVPGGQREFKGWELPKPVAVGNGGAGTPALGSCANVSGGMQGSGSFIWPVASHFVSGYNYSPWHRGLDLAGHLGDPVYAADGGFIVYAGWSNVGYGNLIVVDHGNGWQTWYGHLSQVLVTCGQTVLQGSTLGAVGSTGNASGPHLHFETRYQGDLPNPFSVLPPP